MNTPDKLYYTATLHGRVNDQDLALTGSGAIVMTEGLTQGSYHLLAMPTDLHPSFLAASLITGYPNACACDAGVVNAFVGKSYRYTRRFIGAGAVDLVLQAECKLDGDQLHSQFALTGSIKTGVLDTMEPLIETWTPDTNFLNGLFVAAWKRSNNTSLTVTAASEYCIDGGGEQKDLLHRYIEVESTVNESALELRQRVRLFRRL